MGTINIILLPHSPPPKLFSSMIFSTSFLYYFLSSFLVTHQAEKASLSHILDLMSIIVLTAIWAVCPQDSLAVLGHWVQEKLSQVRRRMSPVAFGHRYHCWLHNIWSHEYWACLPFSWYSVVPTVGNWRPRQMKLDCSLLPRLVIPFLEKNAQI